MGKNTNLSVTTYVSKDQELTTLYVLIYCGLLETDSKLFLISSPEIFILPVLFIFTWTHIQSLRCRDKTEMLLLFCIFYLFWGL